MSGYSRPRAARAPFDERAQMAIPPSRRTSRPRGGGFPPQAAGRRLLDEAAALSEQRRFRCHYSGGISWKVRVRSMPCIRRYPQTARYQTTAIAGAVNAFTIGFQPSEPPKPVWNAV
jgi:hypothetical protein